MREDSITIRITGVSFGDYNKMMAANPPREGHDESFNPSTFFLYVAKRTGKSLEDDGTLEDITPDEWEWIESNLTDGEHDRLAGAVVAVNRTAGARGVDFLSRSSSGTSGFGVISARSRTRSNPPGTVGVDAGGASHPRVRRRGSDRGDRRRAGASVR
jgi:hypothetical protein